MSVVLRRDVFICYQLSNPCNQHTILKRRNILIFVFFQVVLGTLVSYFVHLNEKFQVPILGKIPIGYVCTAVSFGMLEIDPPGHYSRTNV